MNSARGPWQGTGRVCVYHDGGAGGVDIRGGPPAVGPAEDPRGRGSLPSRSLGSRSPTPAQDQRGRAVGWSRLCPAVCGDRDRQREAGDGGGVTRGGGCSDLVRVAHASGTQAAGWIRSEESECHATRLYSETGQGERSASRIPDSKDFRRVRVVSPWKQHPPHSSGPRPCGVPLPQHPATAACLPSGRLSALACGRAHPSRQPQGLSTSGASAAAFTPN